MQFSNLADFFAMDGHGFFVWLSYGLTFLLFFVIALYSVVNHKSTIKQIQKRQQREIKLKQAAQLEEQS